MIKWAFFKVMCNLQVIFGFDILAHITVGFVKSPLFKTPEVRLSTVSSLLSALSVFHGAILFLSNYC